MWVSNSQQGSGFLLYYFSLDRPEILEPKMRTAYTFLPAVAAIGAAATQPSDS